MALSSWVFSTLEKVNIQQHGGFTIPYTAVIENGEVVTAFNDSVEASNSHSSPIAVGNATGHGSRAAGAAATNRIGNTGAINSSFRHVYDASVQTVLQAFGVADEALEMSRSKGASGGVAPRSAVMSMFCERVLPVNNAAKETHTQIAVEYFTAPQTINFLRRGAGHHYPVSTEVDDVELQRHLRETRQIARESVRHVDTTTTSPAGDHDDQRVPKRSGFLQRFIDGGDQAVGILMQWTRHEATTVVIPETEDDRRRVEVTIRARRNKCTAADRLAFPYQRCVTVDGPVTLSERVTDVALMERLDRRVKRAAALILARLNGEAQMLLGASLMFRYCPRSDQLYFLYAPLVQLKSDLVHYAPLAFAVPAQYRGRCKPHGEHIYEEDFIEDPVLSFTRPLSLSPGGRDRNQHDRHSGSRLSTTRSVGDAGDVGGDNGAAASTRGGGLLRAVSAVLDAAIANSGAASLRRPKPGTTGSESVDRGPSETDLVYHSLSKLVSQDYPPGMPVLDEFLNRSGDDVRRRKSVPGMMTRGGGGGGGGDGSEVSKVQRTAPREVAQARRTQEARERASTRVLRMMEGDIPVDPQMLRLLNVPMKDVKALLRASQEAPLSTLGTSKRKNRREKSPQQSFVLDGNSVSNRRALTPRSRERNRAGSDRPSVLGTIRRLPRRSTPVFFAESPSSIASGCSPPTDEARNSDESGNGGRTPPHSSNAGVELFLPSPRTDVQPSLTAIATTSPTVVSPSAAAGTATPTVPRCGSSSAVTLHDDGSPREHLEGGLDSFHDNIRPEMSYSISVHGPASVPLTTEETLVSAVLSWLDAECLKVHLRQTTPIESLAFCVQRMAIAVATAGSGRWSAHAIVVVDSSDAWATARNAALAAADYLEGLWYHLDVTTLTASPTACTWASTRLQQGDVSTVDHLAAVFSLCISRELQTPDALREAGNGDGHSAVAAAAKLDAADAVQQPQWADGGTSQHNVHEDSVAADLVAEADDAPVPVNAAVDCRKESHRSGDDAGTASPAPRGVGGGDSSSSPPPFTTRTGTLTSEAGDGRSVAPGGNSPTEERSAHGSLTPRSVLNLLELAVRAFLVSVPSMIVLSEPSKSNAIPVSFCDVLNDARYPCRARHATLALCQAVLVEGRDAVAAQRFAVPEDIYSAWRSCMTPEELEQKGIFLFAVATGSIPPIVDMEFRTAEWILQTLRGLLVRIFVAIMEGEPNVQGRYNNAVE